MRRPANAANSKNGDFENVMPPDEVLFGRSGAMLSVRKWADKISNTDLPVLLCGDAGTGKELLARWIHHHSTYSGGQFVKVNCAAIPDTLVESELFGYEKGAFTGAHSSKPGRIELAHDGTLFLDEIADLETSLQSKLLHFIQDGTFSRIGAEAEQSVNTRIICTTNRELNREIDAGRFRPDLYYRISVLQARLPRLGERREDVPVLAEYFLAFYQEQFARKCEPLTSSTLTYLQNLTWPGNVRELSNCIARFVLIGPDALLPDDSSKKRKPGPRPTSGANGSLSLKNITKQAIREMERNVLIDALRSNQWNRRKTAEELKISYRALIYKIRNTGLASKRSRSADVQ